MFVLSLKAVAYFVCFVLFVGLMIDIWCRCQRFFSPSLMTRANKLGRFALTHLSKGTSLTKGNTRKGLHSGKLLSC